MNPTLTFVWQPDEEKENFELKILFVVEGLGKYKLLIDRLDDFITKIIFWSFT